MKIVLPVVVKSNFLTFKELVTIHWILRIEWKTIDFILNCNSQECGYGRYLQWKRSLFVNPFRDISVDRAYYNSILNPSNTINPQLHEGTLRLSGVLGEISRDVVRTYQTNPLFREGGSGRDMLQRILSCLVKSRPDVGYCQGMNFVVGAIIIGRLPPDIASQQVTHDSSDEEPDEEESDLPEPIKLSDELMNQVECDVFMLMLELFDRQNKLAMCGLWAPRVPKLKLRVYQLDRLLKWNYPKLHDHFAKLQLSPEVLTAQWFVTLFAYNLPLETTLNLWDYLFETGWEGIFKVAISLLGAMEAQFMALEDLESFALLMREWKKLGHLNIDMSVNALLNKCHKLVINEEVLTRLQECFGMEILSLAIYCYREEAKSARETGTPGRGGAAGGGGGLLGGLSLSVHGGGLPSFGGSSHGGSVSSSTQGVAGGSVHTSHHHHTNNSNNNNSNNSVHHHDSNYSSTGGGGHNRRGSNESVHSTCSLEDCDKLPLGQGKYIGKAIKKMSKALPSSGDSGPSSPSSTSGKELSIGQGKYLSLALKSVGSLFQTASHGSSVGGETVDTPSPGSSFSTNSSIASNHSNFHQETLAMTPTAAELEEQEEEEKIKLGEELPTYWLLRYGSKLNSAEIDQLINYKILLRKLEKTVEVDKAQLHIKIVKACEYHRETEEEQILAEEAVKFHGDNVSRLTEEFQDALLHAQDLAEAVAKLMDVYEVKKVTSSSPSEGKSSSSRDVSGFGGIRNMVTPTKGRSGSIGSFLLSGNSGSKSQSMTSLNSLMRERGLISQTSDKTPTNPNSSNSSNTNGNGKSVLPDRRFSFRNSLFSSSDKLDSPPEDNNNGAKSAFVFTGMRTGVRFPPGFTAPVTPQPTGGETSTNPSTTSTTVPLVVDTESSVNLSLSTGSERMSHGLNELLAAEAEDHNDNDEDDEEEEEVDLTGQQPRGRMIGIADKQSALVGLFDEVEEGDSVTQKRSSWGDRFKRGIAFGGASAVNNRESPVVNETSLSGVNVKDSTQLVSPGLTKNVSFEAVASYTSSPVSGKVSFASESPVPSTSGDNHSNNLHSNGNSSANNVSASVSGRSRAGTINSMSGENSGKSIVPGSDGIARQLKHLEAQSQNSQQTIIEVHRALEEAKKNLRVSKKRLETAKISGDEALVWKKSLCDQLQLLVEDYNKGRTHKLIFISENYLL